MFDCDPCCSTKHGSKNINRNQKDNRKNWIIIRIIATKHDIRPYTNYRDKVLFYHLSSSSQLTIYMPKHIVIIEHDQATLDTMQRILEAEGYVTTGYNFFPSLSELVIMRADCFIIEEWLPHVSGHAICLMLKAKILTSTIPVILVSNTNLFEPMANLCNADGVLGKPFRERKLIQLVSSLLFRSSVFITKSLN
jgi:CheY-like chemotaxis protein